MRFALLTSLIALATAAFAQSADDYVKSEGPIAKAGLLANIGPDGSKSSGAKVSSLLLFIPTGGCLSDIERSHMTAFAHFIGWCRHRVTEHGRPRLPLHMDARLVPRLQDRRGPVHDWRGRVSPPSHRRLHGIPGEDPAGLEPQRQRVHRWSRRAQVQHRRVCLHGLVGAPSARYALTALRLRRARSQSTYVQMALLFAQPPSSPTLTGCSPTETALPMCPTLFGP